MPLLTQESIMLLLAHLIRSWESSRSNKSTNLWIKSLSSIVLHYIPIKFWDESTLSILLKSRRKNKPNYTFEIENNKITNVRNGCDTFQYCCIFGLDTLSSGTHHWKIKLIKVELTSWSLMLGIFKTDDITHFGEFDDPPKGYGIQIGDFHRYLKHNDMGNEGPVINNLSIKNSDMLDFYLNFEKNTFELCLNNVKIKDCDFIKNSGENSKTIENGLYKFGCISGSEGNSIEMIEYNYEKL